MTGKGDAVKKEAKETKVDADLDTETDAETDSGLRHPDGGEVGHVKDDGLMECGCRLAWRIH